jgi:hypothetical protein
MIQWVQYFVNFFALDPDPAHILNTDPHLDPVEPHQCQKIWKTDLKE